jgi:hypothetical protein
VTFTPAAYRSVLAEFSLDAVAGWLRRSPQTPRSPNPADDLYPVNGTLESRTELNRKTMTKNSISSLLVIAGVMALSAGCTEEETNASKIEAYEASTPSTNPYMGAPVTPGKAQNGAITNRKILDRISEVA